MLCGIFLRKSRKAAKNILTKFRSNCQLFCILADWATKIQNYNKIDLKFLLRDVLPNKIIYKIENVYNNRLVRLVHTDKCVRYMV